MPLRFDQVAQLTVPLVSGQTRVGSGFLLAGRLVLTAAHVVGGELTGPIHLSLPCVAASATGATVWSGSAAGLDAALIELDRPPAGPPSAPWRSVRWGRLTGQQPGVPATAVGFPRVLRADDGQRVPDQVAGRVNPGAAMGQRYDLNVEGAHPLSRAGDPSPWSGLSGAALFSGNLLIGVLVIDTPDFQSARLTAVPVWRLLADRGFADELRRHGCPNEVESVELSGLFERSQGAMDSPASLLRADAAIVGFRGREQELDKLRQWCTDQEPLAVALVTGTGGQGKTRLARELCLQMRNDGWLAGTAAHTERGTRAAERLADSQLPVLLAVDYAETRSAQLRKLVEAAEEPSNRVRLLLLARSAGDWWDRLRQDLRAVQVPAMTHALPPLEGSITGRTGAYREALQDFATHLAGLSGGTSPWLETASRLSLADAQQSPADTVLQVHTTALIALLQAGPDAVPTQGSDDVEDVLLKHEQEYWRKTAEARHLDYQPETLRNAVAAASLFGASQQREALATLTRVTGLRDEAEDRLLGVASWLHDLYPAAEDQYWGSLQPDRLVEHFAGRIARLDPDLIVQLLEDASDAQKHQAFWVFSRAVSHQPHLADVLPPVERIRALRGDVPSADRILRLVLQGEITMLALGEPDEWGLAHLLHCTVPMGDEVIRMLPVFTRLEFLMGAVQMNPEWRALHIVEVESQVILRELELEEDEWLGINPWSGIEFKLPPVSRPTELARDEEDTADHREALRVDPDDADAHQGLRNALTELGRFVLPSGRGEGATTVAEYRETLRVDPDNVGAHQGLGHALSALGRSEEAVAAYREALRVDPDFAASHNGLGNALRDLGRLEEAVAAYREALRVDPDFAAAHKSLGPALRDLGRLEEAVAAYREALRVDPDFAASHNGLGNALNCLGRFEEAVAAWRKVLRVDPGNVAAHNNLGSFELYVRGDVRAAEQLLGEAVRLDPMFWTDASGNLAAALVAKEDLRAAREVVAPAAEATAGFARPTTARVLLWQWLLDRSDGSPDTTTLPQVLAALDQAIPPTGGTRRFTDMEIRALALLGLGDDSAAATLRSAASMRIPNDIFFRPMYDLLATPEPPQGLDQLLDVWREIIAVDPAAAGAWGSPDAQ